MKTGMQLCPDCRFLYHSDNRVPCLCCDSTHLTLPTSENLVGIISRLLDMGIDVVSGNCEVHDSYDDIKGYIGKTVQITIELEKLYPTEMLDGLPPDWVMYEYHTVANNQIGSAYSAFAHVDSFLNSKDGDDELEFATMVTVSNFETYLDDKDPESFWSVWKLAGILL
jgi:hypothetical protein